MRLYLLAAAAVFSLASLNSCKKKTPGYCTNEFFQEAFMTDMQGNNTNTFVPGEDMNFNINFNNNSGDSLRVNYTDPWVEYEISSGGQVLISTAPTIPETGLNTAALANGEVISDTYLYTGYLPAASYTLTARCYYEVMGCDNGLRITEKKVDFTVAP